MSRILNLLQAAGGEGALSSALGRWRQAVSEEVASNTEALQYAYAKNVNVQAGITTNTRLVLDTNGLVNGIPRDPGSGEGWVLTIGKLYLLRGMGYFTTFSDATGGALRIQWVDDAASPLASAGADCPGAFFYPTTNTGAQSSSGGVEILYRPTTITNSVVFLRCTNATGTATMPQSSWSASLIEIAG